MPSRSCSPRAANTTSDASGRLPRCTRARSQEPPRSLGRAQPVKHQFPDVGYRPKADVGSHSIIYQFQDRSSLKAVTSFRCMPRWPKKQAALPMQEVNRKFFESSYNFKAIVDETPIPIPEVTRQRGLN